MSKNINIKFDAEVPVLTETASCTKIKAELIEAKSDRRLQILKKQIELEELSVKQTDHVVREAN